MVDPRVPAKERLLVAGAIVYAFVPLDFIPDMLPFVGQVDDAYLIALTLLRLMSVTEPRVVREHWRGGGDVVELVGATALIAGQTAAKENPARTDVKSRNTEGYARKDRHDDHAVSGGAACGGIEAGSIQLSCKRPVDHTLDRVRKRGNQTCITCLQSPISNLFEQIVVTGFVKRHECVTERL